MDVIIREDKLFPIPGQPAVRVIACYEKSDDRLVAGKWVWVEVPEGWPVLAGWPWWGKLMPSNFTGLSDPISKIIWKRSKDHPFSLKGFLHERHHPAFQFKRLGRFIGTLHVLRYMIRFGYKGSRIEVDANAGRDRAYAWWKANGEPDFVPLSAQSYKG